MHNLCETCQNVLLKDDQVLNAVLNELLSSDDELSSDEENVSSQSHLKKCSSNSNGLTPSTWSSTQHLALLTMESSSTSTPCVTLVDPELIPTEEVPIHRSRVLEGSLVGQTSTILESSKHVNSESDAQIQ